MRIAVAGFYHETNTFAVEQNDRADASTRAGEAVFAGAHPRSFVGGFLEGARRPGVELVPAVSVSFAHGGIIHAGVYEHYRRMVVDALRAAMPLDAVYFALHGAMAAEAPYTDAEGCLLAEARRALGEIPFVATYDFHAIMSDAEVSLLTAAFPNDTNPHIDGYERGLEAAGCLLATLRGEIRPVTRLIRVPIIGPNIGQSTWSHLPDEEQRLPLYQLGRLREDLERTPGVLNLAILGGYGYADTPDSCMSVLAVTDNDPALAERMARRLAGEVWQQRQAILDARPVCSIDEGVRRAMARSERPIVLVDLGDDPGSACSADSPAVLEALIRLGARDCALTIRDPEVVRAGHAAGVGATLTLPVGAGIDRRFYQPLPVTGVVKSLDDGNYAICGPTHGGWGREVSQAASREARVGPRVVLRVGNKIDVIFSQRATGKDRDFFKSAGILLEEKRILVVKSNQAHRASFDPVAAGTIELDTPGASTVNYASLPFRHIPRPLWPMDRDFEWEAG